MKNKIIKNIGIAIGMLILGAISGIIGVVVKTIINYYWR
jgi:riboflavin transporter FmnP